MDCGPHRRPPREVRRISRRGQSAHLVEPRGAARPRVSARRQHLRGRWSRAVGCRPV